MSPNVGEAKKKRRSPKDTGWDMAKAELASMPEEVARYAQDLPCKLTHEERESLCEDTLNEACLEVESLKAQRDVAVDIFKTKIRDAEAKVASIQGTLRSGLVTRPVQCVEERIFATKTVRTRRLDTHEVIPGSERSMTKSELQIDLPIPKASDQDPAYDVNGAAMLPDQYDCFDATE